MPFPARRIPPLSEFVAALQRGTLVRRVDEQGLSLFCYNSRAFYGDANVWDDVHFTARGIVFAPDGTILCLPFPKFFNVGEREETLPRNLPAERLRITEKLDGSMIAVWYDGRTWRTSTKGSFNSPQALWASTWLKENVGHERLDSYRGRTLLFEALYPMGTFEDDLIVSYDEEGLVLLAVYDNRTRAEVGHSAVDAIAVALGVRRPTVHQFESVAEALERAHTLGLESEGYVLQFMRSGMRVKVKGDAYRRAVRVLGASTLLAFWESMSEEGLVDPSLLAAVPAERRDDVLPLKHILEDDYRRLRAKADTLSEAANEVGSRREQAIWLDQHAGALQAAVFALISGNDKRAHQVIHKLIKPKGNRRSEIAARILGD